MQKLLKYCSKSHSEFAQKCPHHLWKNPEFFVCLVKKNEDINPTKASHMRMNRTFDFGSKGMLRVTATMPYQDLTFSMSL